MPNCPAFALLTAGENDRHWGPLLRDLAQEDPPTHVFVPDYERSESQFKRGGQVAPRVSTWAVEFVVLYLYLSRSLQLERRTAKPALDRLRKRLAAGIVSSRVGHTELLEFEGGLIHADPDGNDMVCLRCYAPYRAESNADYYDAQAEFGRRIEAMLQGA